MYFVEATEEFEKQAKKVLSPSEQLRLDMLKNRLAENAYIGKPLGLPYFRELKIGPKRLYYTVREMKIILLNASHKKDQPRVIRNLRAELGF